MFVVENDDSQTCEACFVQCVDRAHNLFHAWTETANTCCGVFLKKTS